MPNLGDFISGGHARRHLPAREPRVFWWYEASGRCPRAGIEILRPEEIEAEAHDEHQLEAASILNPDFFALAL